MKRESLYAIGLHASNRWHEKVLVLNKARYFKMGMWWSRSDQQAVSNTKLMFLSTESPFQSRLMWSSTSAQSWSSHHVLLEEQTSSSESYFSQHVQIFPVSILVFHSNRYLCFKFREHFTLKIFFISSRDGFQRGLDCSGTVAHWVPLSLFLLNDSNCSIHLSSFNSKSNGSPATRISFNFRLGKANNDSSSKHCSYSIIRSTSLHQQHISLLFSDEVM